MLVGRCRIPPSTFWEADGRRGWKPNNTKEQCRQGSVGVAKIATDPAEVLRLNKPCANLIAYVWAATTIITELVSWRTLRFVEPRELSYTRERMLVREYCIWYAAARIVLRCAQLCTVK